MRNLGRTALRSLWFCAGILFIACDFAWVALRCKGVPPLRERTLWLQRSCDRVLRIFQVEVEAPGPRPGNGLLVSNHLSYLDILVIASCAPAVFVAKSEVRHWPVFGWFGWLAGTLFVRRAQRSDVARMSLEMRKILDGGHLLVLFPEGTSSNGREILPFKSSLLEPVVSRKHPVFAACIGYKLADGSVENDICYWGDMTFFPHLLKLMTRRGIRARLRFVKIERPAADRKELARQLHQEVARLKAMIGG
jgi:1-acyl-sn-glycerol-3-phosphate acyltransferase